MEEDSFAFPASRTQGQSTHTDKQTKRIVATVMQSVNFCLLDTTIFATYLSSRCGEDSGTSKVVIVAAVGGLTSVSVIGDSVYDDGNCGG